MLHDVAGFGEFRPLANCDTELLLNHVNTDWKALFTNLSIGIELISIFSYYAEQCFNVLAGLYRHSTFVTETVKPFVTHQLIERELTKVQMF